MIRVKLSVLILISGLIWSAVGILLNFMAIRWLINLYFYEGTSAVFIGIILGFIISYFGFNKLIRTNIDRILKYENKACVFAFQSWKSYMIFVIMITLGVLMRTSGVIPKLILTPIYMGIGLALFLSSLQYYKTYLKIVKNNSFTGITHGN